MPCPTRRAQGESQVGAGVQRTAAAIAHTMGLGGIYACEPSDTRMQKHGAYAALSTNS